ncbi:hypothetical protein [Streptomyces sp. NPDC047108]|uniref:hypothetical protein n=1 Tax=Streptomyces sp. NPDC047108 TaxID=3155025 RepID=UPI0033D6F187
MVASPTSSTTARPGRPDRPRTVPGPPGFARRHRRLLHVLAGVLAAVVIFLAGVGTAGIVIVGQMKSTMRSVLAGGGGLPGGSSAGSGGAGPSAPGTGDEDLQDWAKKQGLPEGLPDQALKLLKQRYPDGVPPEIKDRIEERLGG